MNIFLSAIIERTNFRGKHSGTHGVPFENLKVPECEKQENGEGIVVCKTKENLFFRSL
jgi:hypothetical protein